MNLMKKTANLATYPAREESLKQMLESIRGQFDLVRIIMNQTKKEDCPKWLLTEYDNVECWFNKKDFKDNGKFVPLDFINGQTMSFDEAETIKPQHEFYFCLDDDIIYPPDYVDNFIIQLIQYRCILSYHGRQLILGS